jgi:hypothetical protein
LVSLTSYSSSTPAGTNDGSVITFHLQCQFLASSFGNTPLKLNTFSTATSLSVISIRVSLLATGQFYSSAASKNFLKSLLVMPSSLLIQNAVFDPEQFSRQFESLGSNSSQQPPLANLV